MFTRPSTPMITAVQPMTILAVSAFLSGCRRNRQPSRASKIGTVHAPAPNKPSTTVDSDLPRGPPRCHQATVEVMMAAARAASPAPSLRCAAHVEGPPVPSPHTLVVAGSTASAEPAPALRRTPRPNVDHHGSCLFVEVDSLDHRRPVDTEQFAPYVGTEHAILLASFS